MKFNKTPNNIEEFKGYVKLYDSELYNALGEFDVKLYKTKEGKFDFYVNGYDNKNDSLTTYYHIMNDISFWQSFNKKGDIVLPRNYLLPLDFNTVYKIHKDSLDIKKRLKIYNIYRQNLKCEKIRRKEIIYDPEKIMLFRIQNGNIDLKSSNIVSNDFSKKTITVFTDYIRKM